MDGTGETKYIKCADTKRDGEVKSVEYSIEIHEETVGEKTKKDLIDDLRRGEKYEVAIRKTDEWHTEKIHVHEDRWLRIDGEEIEEDDLGELPECD